MHIKSIYLVIISFKSHIIVCTWLHHFVCFSSDMMSLYVSYDMMVAMPSTCQNGTELLFNNEV